MKSSFRRLAPALALVVLAACIPDIPDDASPEVVYEMVCARCHGGDLEGGLGPPLGKGSPSADLPDDFIRMAITDGRGRMPSFVSTLTPQQIEDLVGYIRETQGGG